MMDRTRYRGSRFFWFFAAFLIVILVIGMFMTWTLGGAMAGRIREKNEAQRKKDREERERLRREGREPALEQTATPGK